MLTYKCQSASILVSLLLHADVRGYCSHVNIYCQEGTSRKREQTGDRGEARVPHYGVPLVESDNIQIRRTKHRNKIRRGMQSGRFSPKTSMVNEHVALFPDWSTAVYVIT